MVWGDWDGLGMIGVKGVAMLRTSGTKYMERKCISLAGFEWTGNIWIGTSREHVQRKSMRALRIVGPPKQANEAFCQSKALNSTKR